MAAYLSENLQIDDEDFELSDVGGGIFQVEVNESVMFDNRTDEGKFPDQDTLLTHINHYFKKY